MSWETPRLLKAGGWAVTIASLFLAAVVIAGAVNRGNTATQVGRETAPGIAAADEIAAALAAMDASAAEELLGGEGAEGARNAFGKHRTDFHSAIIEASANARSNVERQLLGQIEADAGAWTDQIQIARDKRQMDAYRQAVSIMDQRVLPAVTKLETANRAALDETWSKEQAAAPAGVGLVAAAGILAGALLTVQVFLAGRTRRALNLGLFAASIAAFVFIVDAGQSIKRIDADLKVATKDAAGSVAALWNARALAYLDAAEQSRAALDGSHAAVYRKAFSETDEKLRAALGQEMNNAAIPGEREAAEEADTRHQEWVKAAQTTPAKAGNAGLGEFDKAIAKTIAIDYAALEDAVARSERESRDLSIAAAVFTAIICGFAWFGLRPRLREYSA
jgi:hypothetical protein